MLPVKGKEPGAFVIMSKRDGQKYVMSERTLKEIVDKLGEDKFGELFTGEWVVLTDEEKKLAVDIERKYFTGKDKNDRMA